ncbi:MAG: hypothetical protein ACTHLH_10090 [Solirubrobacterales bacterium]
MTTVAAILFWLSAGLIVYTHLGYPLVLAALARLAERRSEGQRRFHPFTRKMGEKGGNHAAEEIPTV